MSRTFQKDLLNIEVHDTRDAMGAAAARACGDAMRKLLETKEEIRMIFAAAPSQNEFLEHLIQEDVDWSRVVGYHMDEYMGYPVGSPFSFALFLKNAIFDRVPFRRVEYLDISAEDIEAEAERYSALLRSAPADIVCMGIGENGHIAFNDPGVADFQDTKLVKRADLDEKCRNQQVADGCFPNLDAVPKYALTLTVPALMQPEHVFCIVPGPRKAEAVKMTLEGPVNDRCPASILRQHKDATLYIDTDAASLLTK